MHITGTGTIIEIRPLKTVATKESKEITMFSFILECKSNSGIPMDSNLFDCTMYGEQADKMRDLLKVKQVVSVSGNLTRNTDIDVFKIVQLTPASSNWSELADSK